MLGPSGSGKTTCLRLISGFESPTAGEICIFAENVSATPPLLRNVNTAFQDYALYPHMNLRDNVACGLVVKAMSRRQSRRTARAGQTRKLQQPQTLPAFQWPTPARRARPRLGQ